MMFPRETKDGDVVFDPMAFYNRIGHLEAIQMRDWAKHNPP